MNRLGRILTVLGVGVWLLGTAPQAAADGLCSVDVDGNGQTEALTDGLLLIRHLFGLSGAALTNGTVGTGATRITGAEIAAYLQQPDCLTMADVDGNGIPEALTDGLLVIRHLFGLKGEALIAGVLAPTRRASQATSPTIPDPAARPCRLRV